MRQRVRVVAIVKNQAGEVLLLRRKRNDQVDIGVPQGFLRDFELPNSRIEFGEQPEDALMRVIEDDIGIKVKDFHLLDAASFIDPQYGEDVANIYLIFEIRLAVAGADSKVNIGLNNRKYIEYHFVNFSPTNPSTQNPGPDNLVPATELRIEEWAKFVLEIAYVLRKNGPVSSPYAPEDLSRGMDVEVYVDGASKGNPGPSATGYVLISPTEGEIERGGASIGLGNSTEAEYEAIKRGVARASQLGYKRVRIKSDALTIVKQIQGSSMVKDRRFWRIYAEIERMTDAFDSFEIVYIPRELNAVADAEAGKALDEANQM